ncbi:hypothetical protein AVEN_226472-1 [Araneus ventricosus]|uniref:Uncharacterized protein n=1 Tax=Araneus ventricosus TaxID=182803 RepID=A0A4Y2E1F6_ARAVE|nr:hypothetical protein AVEN_226472-1 [Araneus ventricosus]
MHLCRIMRRGAVCVPHVDENFCQGKLNLFMAVRGRTVSCRKRDSSFFPAAWMSRDSWQDVKCGPPRIVIFQSDCQSSIIFFFLKIDFRKGDRSLNR